MHGKLQTTRKAMTRQLRKDSSCTSAASVTCGKYGRKKGLRSSLAVSKIGLITVLSKERRPKSPGLITSAEDKSTVLVLE